MVKTYNTEENANSEDASWKVAWCTENFSLWRLNLVKIFYCVLRLIQSERLSFFRFLRKSNLSFYLPDFDAIMILSLMSNWVIYRPVSSNGTSDCTQKYSKVLKSPTKVLKSTQKYSKVTKSNQKYSKEPKNIPKSVAHTRQAKWQCCILKLTIVVYLYLFESDLVYCEWHGHGGEYSLRSLFWFSM